MHIGVCQIQLRLPENGTLKEKRQVFRSVVSRTRQKFNVSVAEVASNDHHQLLTLGVSCVSSNSRHANEVLSHVVEYIQSLRLDGELVDYQIEIISGA